MKRFSRCELTKELVLLFTFGVTILLLYSAVPDYYSALQVQAQVQQQQQLPSPIIGVKITSPSTGQQVPAGELTISGTSTDNATTDCTVYADWNNTKPFQKAVATGAGGVNDYSRWTFKYAADYHLITNGTNNLTSKLSCIDDSTGGSTANLTKNYSVNVIGIATTNNTADATSIEDVQQDPSAIESNNRPTTVMKEGVTANNISSQRSPPIPPVSNDSNLDRVNVNITSHKPGQQVLTGNLTIAGVSSDNVATDCTVYAGWDGQKPFQNTKALGPGGVNDYSTWDFTYTPAYHAITNKTNQLTAQISCLNDNANNTNPTTAANLTKSYSVNVIGITESSAMVTSPAEEKQNNGTASSIITSPKSIPSVPTPLPLLPSTQKQEEENDEDNEEEPQTEPEPEPEDDDDTTIYWDIEEDIDENNEEVFDFEDNLFDLE
ncbi:MAG TPA: hypothetical protein VE445_06430 [Nitrososphaeraceae archaeon]|nr:hypothetical protein [Nitrososphaeraceae archaeon]